MSVNLDFPARIELDDVVLRHYRADDAPALARAMAESYDELHPWMAWATPDGITQDACRRFVDVAADQLAARTDFNYGIFAAPDDAATPEVLGGCGLHDRLAPGAIEIGYWLHSGATGRGLMTRVAAALTQTALAHPDIDQVEIHTDEANTASAAVARRLGYTLVTIAPTTRPGGPAGSGRHMIWATGPGVEIGDARR